MPAHPTTDCEATRSVFSHLPETVLVCLSEDDPERNVREGLGHEVAQGERLACASLAEKAHGRVKGKVVDVHLELADGPDAGRDRVDDCKDLAERVGLGLVFRVGLLVGAEDFGGASAALRGVVGLGGASHELLAAHELGDLFLGGLVVLAVIGGLLLGSRLFGCFFCSHEQ
jgi:hypothetical protein